MQVFFLSFYENQIPVAQILPVSRIAVPISQQSDSSHDVRSAEELLPQSEAAFIEIEHLPVMSVIEAVRLNKLLQILNDSQVQVNPFCLDTSGLHVPCLFCECTVVMLSPSYQVVIDYIERIGKKRCPPKQGIMRIPVAPVGTSHVKQASSETMRATRRVSCCVPLHA